MRESANAVTRAASKEVTKSQSNVALQKATVQAREAKEELARVQARTAVVEQELARERNERQFEAHTAESAVAELKAQLAAVDNARRSADRVRLLQQRTIWGLGAGLGLTLVLGSYAVEHRRPSPVPGVIAAPKKPAIDAPFPPVKLTDASELAAYQRFIHAIGSFPPSEIPKVLQAADKILRDSGSPVCSVEWGRGGRAVVMESGANGKLPLAAAFTRCAAAVERLLPP